MNFQSLKCFPNNHNGDKIILPSSILDTLITMEIQYPLLFELVTNEKKTHCGVLEFTSDEGTCFVPQWIIKNLGIKEGVMIWIRNVSLPKATFIKFKPCLSFLDLYDPRAVLEYTLRSFSCVTIGDKLQFDYNFKTYSLEVIEVLPKKASCIIEADIEVDFDEPDYPDGYESTKIKNKTDHQPNEVNKSNQLNESKPQSGERTQTITKWGKLSKLAHFQGVGNKLN